MAFKISDKKSINLSTDSSSYINVSTGRAISDLNKKNFEYYKFENYYICGTTDAIKDFIALNKISSRLINTKTVISPPKLSPPKLSSSRPPLIRDTRINLQSSIGSGKQQNNSLPPPQKTLPPTQTLPSRQLSPPRQISSFSSTAPVVANIPASSQIKSSTNQQLHSNSGGNKSLFGNIMEHVPFVGKLFDRRVTEVPSTKVAATSQRQPVAPPISAQPVLITQNATGVTSQKSSSVISQRSPPKTQLYPLPKTPATVDNNVCDPNTVGTALFEPSSDDVSDIPDSVIQTMCKFEFAALHGKCKVARIIDGDTFEILLYVPLSELAAPRKKGKGKGEFKNAIITRHITGGFFSLFSCRLAGIDTAEKNTLQGLIAKYFMQDLISHFNNILYFRIVEFDKYGRILINLYLDSNYNILLNTILIGKIFNKLPPLEQQVVLAYGGEKKSDYMSSLHTYSQMEINKFTKESLKHIYAEQLRATILSLEARSQR